MQWVPRGSAHKSSGILGIALCLCVLCFFIFSRIQLINPLLQKIHPLHHHIERGAGFLGPALQGRDKLILLTASPFQGFNLLQASKALTLHKCMHELDQATLETQMHA